MLIRKSLLEFGEAHYRVLWRTTHYCVTSISRKLDDIEDILEETYLLFRAAKILGGHNKEKLNKAKDRLKTHERLLTDGRRGGCGEIVHKVREG